MRESMVERVARAIMSKTPDGDLPHIPLAALEAARAAIAAMREPDPGMVDAGSPHCFVNLSNYGGPQAKEVYQAMIDSALGNDEAGKDNP